MPNVIRTITMFTITEADDSVSVVQHDGSAIHVRTITTVVTPGEVDYDELTQWVQQQATYDSDLDEWTMDTEEIGQFDSMGSDDVQDLVAEVKTYLEDRGVTVRVGQSG